MTDVDDLLQKTSRTFAVTIPMLPAPTRQEVGIAYLLFRIVDTFEDGTLWPAQRRIEAIHKFLPLLDGPDPAGAQRLAAECTGDPPVEHAGYLELLREMPYVLGELERLPELSRHLIRSHVRRAAEGMSEVIARADADRELRLTDVDDLRRYCYVVAGIVGEMLTELFVLNRPSLAGIGEMLRERSAAFGEGLQLVNILKDAPSDAKEGRIYIPATHREEVVELAHADLQLATEYTLALQNQGAERGLVIFNALLVRFARGTLAAIRERRPAGKLTRLEVFALVAAVMGDVDHGRPALPTAGPDAFVPAAE